MPNTRDGTRLRWAAVGVLAIIEFSLIACLILGQADASLLVGTITAVAALLVLTAWTSDGNTLAAGSTRGRGELETILQRLEETDRRTSDLVRLVLPREEFQTLRKLAIRRFGPYAMGNGLERELRHLRQLGYVDIPSIGAIPRHGGELAEAVRITPSGERFVELREQLEREAVAPQVPVV